MLTTVAVWGCLKNKPKMAYSRDAFIREILKGLEREIEKKREGETGGILEIDWREAYHRLICNYR